MGAEQKKWSLCEVTLYTRKAEINQTKSRFPLSSDIMMLKLPVGAVDMAILPTRSNAATRKPPRGLPVPPVLREHLALPCRDGGDPFKIEFNERLGLLELGTRKYWSRKEGNTRFLHFAQHSAYLNSTSVV